MAHCKAPHSCGVVALCVAYDANDNTHIIAFAHLPTEDGAQWTWFMQHVKDAFPTLAASSRMCTISDQDKVSNETMVESYWAVLNANNLGSLVGIAGYISPPATSSMHETLGAQDSSETQRRPAAVAVAVLDVRSNSHEVSSGRKAR